MAWTLSSVLIPSRVCRVVCGLREVIASFCPRIWLSRVDLPTLGRPTMAIWPQRGAVASVIRFLHAHGNQRLSGGFLFGQATAVADAEGLAGHQFYPAFDPESPAMRLATDIDHLVLRQFAVLALQVFLQTGFRIL